MYGYIVFETSKLRHGNRFLINQKYPLKNTHTPAETWNQNNTTIGVDYLNKENNKKIFHTKFYFKTPRYFF